MGGVAHKGVGHGPDAAEADADLRQADHLRVVAPVAHGHHRPDELLHNPALVHHAVDPDQSVILGAGRGAEAVGHGQADLFHQLGDPDVQIARDDIAVLRVLPNESDNSLV